MSTIIYYGSAIALGVALACTKNKRLHDFTFGMVFLMLWLTGWLRYGGIGDPLRNDLPAYHRARVIRSNGAEPRVHIQFRTGPSRRGTKPEKPAMA